jgi:hypothetical protein
MISVFLKDLRWRMALVVLAALLFYSQEPGFHQHEGVDPDAVALGPLGVSATLSHFAALSMIILLAGFVSGERREGITRINFSHPTSPLAYYGLKWGLAYVLSLSFALAFLLFGQIAAWGEFRGGASGMILPVLSALISGGLMAFFSVTLPRGDAWIVFLLLLAPVLFPQLLSLGLSGISPQTAQVILTLLPPQNALSDVWNGLLLGDVPLDAVLFPAAYGLVFLVAAIVILRLREWP